MEEIKSQLQDLSFKYLDSEKYALVKDTEENHSNYTIQTTFIFYIIVNRKKLMTLHLQNTLIILYTLWGYIVKYKNFKRSHNHTIF